MMRPSFKLKQLRTDGRSIERTSWTDVLTGYQEELLYEHFPPALHVTCFISVHIRIKVYLPGLFSPESCLGSGSDRLIIFLCSARQQAAVCRLLTGKI